MLFRKKLVVTSIVVLLAVVRPVAGAMQGTSETQDSPFLPSERLPADNRSMPAPPTPAIRPGSSPSDKSSDAPAPAANAASSTTSSSGTTTSNSGSIGTACDKNCGGSAAQSDDLAFPSCDDWTYPACDPLWTVRADSLFLNRSSPNSKTLLTDDEAFKTFDANQFEFPVQFGWDIDLQYRLACDWSIDARYIDVGVHGASATAPQTPEGGGVLYGGTNVAGILNQGALDSTLSYDSRLQSVEINLRRDYCPNLTLLAGVRYLQLTDEITVDQVTTNNLVHDEQQLKAYNGLIGFQIGADATLWSQGRFSLESDVRAGIYGDAARNHLSFASYNYSVETGTHAGSAAFVGEASVRASYKLTERWSFVAGYELLWLDDVALAYEQPSVNPSPLNGPATSVKLGGDVFYQGAIVGLEFRH